MSRAPLVRAARPRSRGPWRGPLAARLPRPRPLRRLPTLRPDAGAVFSLPVYKRRSTRSSPPSDPFWSNGREAGRGRRRDPTGPLPRRPHRRRAVVILPPSTPVPDSCRVHFEHGDRRRWCGRQGGRTTSHDFYCRVLRPDLGGRDTLAEGGWGEEDVGRQTVWWYSYHRRHKRL